MRRPQGFDRPPQAGGRGTAAPEDPSRAEPRRGRARDAEPTTDPIPVQPVAAGFDVRARTEASVRQARDAARQFANPAQPAMDVDPDATQPITPLAHDASLRSPREPASDSRSSKPRSAAADVRSARRALARARSARRRYERQEVRRFTQRSRRRRRAWLISVGSVLVVCLGVLGAAYSPLMALREVRVEGAARIPPAEIQAALGSELGTPLPLIASGEVRSALEGFPLIETYSIETLPPGTLVVRIVERTPVGVIETPEGLELVDAAGVVIERPAERPDGQPVIDAGPVTSEGFRAAAAVIRSLPAEVRGQVVRATAETPDDVRFELAGGARVVWGSAEQSTAKATVLASLMAQVPADAVAQYDVSAPMSPVTSG